MLTGPSAPVSCDIVLAGGGHSHVQVMTAFAMARKGMTDKKLAGVRLTLVSGVAETPYSGMLPGAIAGVYARRDMHIDLVRLAQATGVRFIHAHACGLDHQGKKLFLENRPPLAYDFLSLNIGITPDLTTIAGADQYGISVKPISTFLARAEAVLAAAMHAGGPRRFVIVGAGAAGVEIACAFHARLALEAPRHGLDTAMFRITLVSRETLVPALNIFIRKKIQAALTERAITIMTDFCVCAVDAAGVTAVDGRHIAADAVFFATAARAPGWLAGTGLPLDAQGCVQTNATLQVTGEPALFAAGDCAGISGQPRPKAGVFAVRQGPVLAHNLMAAATGRSYRNYHAQKKFLTIIALGDQSALAARGKWFAVGGRLIWRWKDRIDRRFMAMFSGFGAEYAHPATDDDLASGLAMRCAGCAAKVGPDALAQALAMLPPAPAPQDEIIGLGTCDDGAIIALDGDRATIETIDYLPALIDDAYVFGQIAALHAMNDVLAMGGRPTRALALASLPYASPDKAAQELFQLLAGARYQMDAHGVTIAGGHSAEGAALALGFAVSGRASITNIIRKGGLGAGDCLILTKPVGIGVIMAAHTRGAAPAQASQNAVATMLTSNFLAVRCLENADHDGQSGLPADGSATIHASTAIHAMTDVTGFGLAGHLTEMLRADHPTDVTAPPLTALLDLSAIPLCCGALALAQQGFRSSLSTQNASAVRCAHRTRNLASFEQALLTDPQTSGPLLIGLSAEHAAASVARLQMAGYPAAAIIGVIKQAEPGDQPIFVQGSFCDNPCL